MIFFWGEMREGRTPTDPKTPLMVNKSSENNRIVALPVTLPDCAIWQALSAELI